MMTTNYTATGINYTGIVHSNNTGSVTCTTTVADLEEQLKMMSRAVQRAGITVGYDQCGVITVGYDQCGVAFDYNEEEEMIEEPANEDLDEFLRGFRIIESEVI